MGKEVRISRRFSFVIPKSIRKKLEVREGKTAIVVAEGDKIIIEPLPEDPYEVLVETLGDFSYTEERYERKAEEWLREVARPRLRSSTRA